MSDENEIDRLRAEVSRLRSENAQLQGQQSAVRDLPASEVDDLREEIATDAEKVRLLLEQVSRLQADLAARDFELEALSRENGQLAEMLAKGVYIESAALRPESYNIRARGTVAMLLAEKLVLFFRASGCWNFVTSTIEMEFTDPKECERYALTIQRLDGEDSPAQKLDRQAKRIAELEAAGISCRSPERDQTTGR